MTENCIANSLGLTGDLAHRRVFPICSLPLPMLLNGTTTSADPRYGTTFKIESSLTPRLMLLLNTTNLMSFESNRG